MAPPSKRDARQERLELLSSPVIMTESSDKEFNQDLDSSNSDSQEHPGTQTDQEGSSSTPHIYTSSPLRFRERFANLFSPSKKNRFDKNVPISEKNNHDKCEVILKPEDRAEQKEVVDRTTDESGSSLIDVALNDEVDANEGDIEDDKEDDDDDDNEILKLRAVIQQQERQELQERDDTLHDCSSEYAEETYLNTIRNQDISALPFGKEETRGRKLLDLPVSRLFLNLYPEQEHLFRREKDWSSGNYNYSLFCTWCKWTVMPLSNPNSLGSSDYVKSHRKRLQMVGKIPDKLQLYETISAYKSNFLKPSKPFEIHIFREGIRPRKSSNELINGGVLELKMRFSKRKSYKIWKDVVRFILDDCYVKFLNYQVYELRQRIVGLEFILTDYIKGNGDVIGAIALKFWVVPTLEERRLSKGILVDLCQLLKEGLPDDLGDRVSDISYTENRTHLSHRVFEDKEESESEEEDEETENDEDQKD